MSEACGNCKFYLDQENGEGMCRRYPKVYIGDDENMRIYFGFPEMKEGNWCGEWKEIPEK